MKKHLLRAVAALLLTGLIAECGLMAAVYVSETLARPAGSTDVAIVLGARVMPDGSMSDTLLHRAEAAYRLYAEGLVSSFILCGAQGSDEPCTEASAMARYLSKQGVPESALFREEGSYDTVQNLARAREIMRENGWETASLVTSAYHLTRALWLARDATIDAQGVAADNPARWIDRMKARAREALSWVNYFTGGRIRRLLFGRQSV